MTEPRICLFIGEDSPPQERWLAVLYLGGKRLPIVFAGPDDDELRERAAAWWRDEVAKEQAKRDRARHAVASKTKRPAEGVIAP